MVYDPEHHDHMMDDEPPVVASDSRCLAAVSATHSWTEENGDRCAWCGCRTVQPDAVTVPTLIDELEADRALRQRPDGRTSDERYADDAFGA